MKKVSLFLTVFILAVSLLSGCMKKNEALKDDTEKNMIEVETENEEILPFTEPMEFYFSSGAGAWGTELYLEKDGSFEGGFHDTNMGESGEENPYGTCYVCNFSGKFEK